MNGNIRRGSPGFRDEEDHIFNRSVFLVADGESSNFMKPMNTIFKNPYLNAVYAELYIVLIVSVIRGISAPNTPDTIFDPIAGISLFVLSAAVMGYLFLGEPLQLYFDGKKKEAVMFFMRTVVGFAAITAVAFIIVSRIPR